MKEKVIVSMASLGREDYREAQLNLIKSCVNAGWDGDYMIRCLDGYCDEYMGVKIKLGSWPHTKKYGDCWGHDQMPYAFKPHAILEAYEGGYREIVWADSTCRMLINPDPLIGLAFHNKGIVAWDNLGYPVVNWTTDTAMKNMGETVESLQGVRQIMACCLVFNFNNPELLPIFEYWVEQSKNNSFHPDGTCRAGFIGSRHDQSALSIIMHKFNVPMLDYGQGFCYYPNNETGEHINGNKIYIINKGVKD
jgi:hypothetical protein